MNTKLIFSLVLALGMPAYAATAAEPLPTVALDSCFNTVLILAIVMAVLGFIGLLTASADHVDLHYGMGDVYLSVPLALATWMGLGSLMLMGARGDDLLPFMQQKMWLSGASIVLALILSFILVRRCNPQAGFFSLTLAAFGRLFVDTLSQLFSILVVLGGLWVIFGGGKKQNGEHVSFMGRLGCAFAFVWMFNLAWGSIRTTTRETVSSTNGYLLGILNVLCIAAAGYAGYLYVNATPASKPADLVAAVQAGDADACRAIMAANPLLERNAAIEHAVVNKQLRMLNVIVRDEMDLDYALDVATQNDKTSVQSFLNEKARLSAPAEK